MLFLHLHCSGMMELPELVVTGRHSDVFSTILHDKWHWNFGAICWERNVSCLHSRKSLFAVSRTHSTDDQLRYFPFYVCRYHLTATFVFWIWVWEHIRFAPFSSGALQRSEFWMCRCRRCHLPGHSVLGVATGWQSCQGCHGFLRPVSRASGRKRPRGAEQMSYVGWLLYRWDLKLDEQQRHLQSLAATRVAASGLQIKVACPANRIFHPRWNFPDGGLPSRPISGRFLMISRGHFVGNHFPVASHFVACTNLKGPFCQELRVTLPCCKGNKIDDLGRNHCHIAISKCSLRSWPDCDHSFCKEPLCWF